MYVCGWPPRPALILSTMEHFEIASYYFTNEDTESTEKRLPHPPPGACPRGEFTFLSGCWVGGGARQRSAENLRAVASAARPKFEPVAPEGETLRLLHKVNRVGNIHPIFLAPVFRRCQPEKPRANAGSTSSAVMRSKGLASGGSGGHKRIDS